jgi:hypothetical protein
VWRSFANAATRDSQGINLPGDLKVTALGTPGEAVNIATGATIIRNAQQPGESYIGRARTTTQVAIPRNNTGSVVRHLLIARIIDPDYSPWQPSGSAGAPNTDVATGPYFQPFLVSGVAANVVRASQVVSYAAVALARIDVASVASGASPVTQAMIVDCREMAQPRIAFAYDIQRGLSTEFVAVTDTTYKDWPSNSLQVYVPRWATHAQVTADLLGIKTTGDSDMVMRTSLGGSVSPDVVFDNNIPPGATESVPFSAYGEFLVTGVQDTTVTLKTQAKRTLVSNTGLIYFDTKQFIKYDVRFSERVV